MGCWGLTAVDDTIEFRKDVVQHAVEDRGGGCAVHGKSMIEIVTVLVKAEARNGVDVGIVQFSKILDERAADKSRDALTAYITGLILVSSTREIRISVLGVCAKEE